MSFTKTKIYNLACNALLLSRQIVDADSDTNTNEVKVLNQFWESSLANTLADMDLDSLSESIPLELIIQPNDGGVWTYIYKYPTRCAKLRRIVSCARTDTNDTFIEKKVAMYNGQKAIFTNEYQAVAECITKDVTLAALDSSAGWAVAYQLAFLAAPLLVGKGAKTLRKEIYEQYLLAVNNAREHDKQENFSYQEPWVASEFVRARLS